MAGSIGTQELEQIAIGSRELQSVSIGTQIVWMGLRSFTDNFDRPNGLDLGSDWKQWGAQTDRNQIWDKTAHAYQRDKANTGYTWTDILAKVPHTDALEVTWQVVAPRGGEGVRDETGGGIMFRAEDKASGKRHLTAVFAPKQMFVATALDQQPTVPLVEGDNLLTKRLSKPVEAGDRFKLRVDGRWISFERLGTPDWIEWEIPEDHLNVGPQFRNAGIACSSYATHSIIGGWKYWYSHPFKDVTFAEMFNTPPDPTEIKVRDDFERTEMGNDWQVVNIGNTKARPVIYNGIAQPETGREDEFTGYGMLHRQRFKSGDQELRVVLANNGSTSGGEMDYKQGLNIMCRISNDQQSHVVFHIEGDKCDIMISVNGNSTSRANAAYTSQVGDELICRAVGKLITLSVIPQGEDNEREIVRFSDEKGEAPLTNRRWGFGISKHTPRFAGTPGWGWCVNEISAGRPTPSPPPAPIEVHDDFDGDTLSPRWEQITKPNKMIVENSAAQPKLTDHVLTGTWGCVWDTPTLGSDLEVSIKLKMPTQGRLIAYNPNANTTTQIYMRMKNDWSILACLVIGAVTVETGRVYIGWMDTEFHEGQAWDGPVADTDVFTVRAVGTHYVVSRNGTKIMDWDDTEGHVPKGNKRFGFAISGQGNYLIPSARLSSWAVDAFDLKEVGDGPTPGEWEVVDTFDRANSGTLGPDWPVYLGEGSQLRDNHAEPKTTDNAAVFMNSVKELPPQGAHIEALFTVTATSLGTGTTGAFAGVFLCGTETAGGRYIRLAVDSAKIMISDIRNGEPAAEKSIAFRRPAASEEFSAKWDGTKFSLTRLSKPTDIVELVPDVAIDPAALYCGVITMCAGKVGSGGLYYYSKAIDQVKFTTMAAGAKADDQPPADSVPPEDETGGDGGS